MEKKLLYFNKCNNKHTDIHELFQEIPIAHTDLRPANILVTPVGRLTISNFGIAAMNTLNKVCVVHL